MSSSTRGPRIREVAGDDCACGRVAVGAGCALSPLACSSKTKTAESSAAAATQRTATLSIIASA